jgi:hypothetical protein
LTTTVDYQVLAIVNGDPSSNAGARLRISNWVNSLPKESAVQVAVVRRPKLAAELFQLVKNWLHSLTDTGLQSSDCEGTRRVVIMQKAFSLEMVALLLYLRLLDIAVVQDICDPPLKVYNPEPFTKPFVAVFYLSLVCHYLVDAITVSSSVLKRSFSQSSCSVTYIADCIDEHYVGDPASLPVPEYVYPRLSRGEDQLGLPRLNLLWFGGSARPNSKAGIEELYAYVDHLKPLAENYSISLSICTILTSDALPYFEEWARATRFLEIKYYPWSLAIQEALLQACDFCFLPRIQSLATFYKSPNRVILALRHGRRTISNTISSDDYEELSILTISQLLESPLSSLARCDSSTLVFPSSWETEAVVNHWLSVIRQASARRESLPSSSALQRLILIALLILTRGSIAVVDLNKSVSKSLHQFTAGFKPRRKRKKGLFRIGSPKPHAGKSSRRPLK